MKRTELNFYIYNYVKNDLTNGSLILAGPAGSGKSHYLRHDLEPYLATRSEAFTCLRVSLNGTKDISDVSRSLYVENKTRQMPKKTENRVKGALMAKTLLRGIANYYDVDITADKDDLNHLYNSIDLTGKLVIFEDIEKSSLDPEEFTAYVDSLTRQDGVKVMVVLNDVSSNTRNSLNARLIGASCDVLLYEPDTDHVIRSVMKEYDNAWLEAFDNDEDTGEIAECFERKGAFIISTLFSAFQKAVDIYRWMDESGEEYDRDFTKAILMGILEFYLRLDSGPDLKWEDEDQLSFRLGGGGYPLFRFCYDYITEHVFEPARVSSARSLYRDFRAHDSAGVSDGDLEILYSWERQKESVLTETMDRIAERLADPEDLPLREYGRIASCFVRAGRTLEYDTSAARERMIRNLSGKGLEVNSDYITRYLSGDGDDPGSSSEFAELRKGMLNALVKADRELSGFSYLPSQIGDFSGFVRSDIDRILSFGAFARALDNGRIRDMLSRCSAEEICTFREAYISVYAHPSSRTFLYRDREALGELSEMLGELEAFEGFDRIQKKNIRDFIKCLEEISLSWE